MERKGSIDLLRIISAVAVILIHVVSSPIGNNTSVLNAALPDTLNRIHMLLNWSVPVFFIITGYCLLQKKELTYKYCFTHVLKYVGVLFTVGLAYALMEEIFIQGGVNALALLRAVCNVISGNLWDHMWFVYAIIGIYLVMPVIHLFIQKSEQNAIVLTILLFVFSILIPSFENYISVGVELPFGGYLFYVCLGGTIARVKVGPRLSYIAYVLGFLAMVWISLEARKMDFGCNHVAVCAMAIGAFLAISRANISSSKVMVGIAKCTWGVYLIHPFFINVAIKVWKVELLSSYVFLRLTVFFVVIATLSLFATYALRKVPFLKELF